MIEEPETVYQPYQGIFIRFELFEGPTAGYSKRDSRYLVSVIAKSQLRGIALMTEEEMKDDEDENQLCFGINWEIVSEDVDIKDPDIDQLFFEP